MNYFEKYDNLSKALRYINDNSKSNDLPYHGLDHVYTVFNHITYFLDYYKDELRVKGTSEVNVHEIYEQELLLAALFHDFDHSGGKYPDYVNVQVACDGVKKFWRMYESFNYEHVQWIIKGTEYPYVIKKDNLTVEQSILRDADLSYMFGDMYLVKALGLQKELKAQDDVFIKGSLEFYKNIPNELTNEYFLGLFNNNRKRIVDDLFALHKIYKEIKIK